MLVARSSYMVGVATLSAAILVVGAAGAGRCRQGKCSHGGGGVVS